MSSSDAEDLIAPLLAPELFEAVEAFAEKHDVAHVLRFCCGSLDEYPQLAAESRIRNLMALMPEPFGFGSSAARAARTQYAIRVVEQIAGYGVDINAPLSGVELHRGREIIRLCFAFPERWSSLDSSSECRDEELIGFIASHTEDVDTIIDACAVDDALLSVDYLCGYLDKTAPPLREGYL
jgi:hypothetical protein